MLKWSRPSKQISVSLLLSLFSFLHVVMVAGDFMLLSTGVTFIWRDAEGTRRCHSHPCCVLHAVPDCEKMCGGIFDRHFFVVDVNVQPFYPVNTKWP
jgi:hypothetical protein